MPLVLVTGLVELVADRFLPGHRMEGSSEQSTTLEPADRGMQRTETIKYINTKRILTIATV